MRKTIIISALVVLMVSIVYAGSPPVIPSSGGSIPTLSSLGAAASNAVLTTTTFALGLQRGSNTALVFSGTPNYTVTAHGATFTEAGGTMTASGTTSGGTPSFTPTTAIPAVVGNLYQIIVPVTTSGGSFTVTYGGVTSPTVTTATNNTYTFYIKATSTGSLIISAGSGAQSFVITNMTVKRAGYDPNSGVNATVVTDTNTGMSVQNNVYMPPATTGWVFQEYVLASYAVVLLSAQGTDTWYLGTSAYTSSVTLGAVRQTEVTFGSYATGYWDLLGLNGSVTGS